MLEICVKLSRRVVKSDHYPDFSVNFDIFTVKKKLAPAWLLWLDRLGKLNQFKRENPDIVVRRRRYLVKDCWWGCCTRLHSGATSNYLFRTPQCTYHRPLSMMKCTASCSSTLAVNSMITGSCSIQLNFCRLYTPLLTARRALTSVTCWYLYYSVKSL